MPSLRDLRDRIKSVKSTRKITAAMKMVAASKLRRAQEQADKARPYAQSMATALSRVTANISITPDSSPLLVGTGSEQRHLLVVVSSDRGLCGGFNANILKETRKLAYELKDQGKDVSIVCVGRKGYDSLRSDLKSSIEHKFFDVTSQKRIRYVDAQDIRDYIVNQFSAGSFDVCTLVYSEFKSIIIQKPKRLQLIPFDMSEVEDAEVESNDSIAAPYSFEPDEQAILDTLLPRNIGVQLYRALLDSAAGEQASRMTAMDNATRNAGDRINELSMEYNRARQAYITKELIEIISGAEAV